MTIAFKSIQYSQRVTMIILMLLFFLTNPCQAPLTRIFSAHSCSPQSIAQTRLRLQKRMIGIDEDSSPDEWEDEAAAAKKDRDERFAKEVAKRRKARTGTEETRKGGGQKGPGH